MKKIIVAVFFLLLISCSENNLEESQNQIEEEFRDSVEVLAVVNNVEINETDFNIYKRAISISQPNLADDEILDKLIEFELVSQKAKEEGFNQLPEIASKIHLQTNEFLSDIYIKRIINSASDEVLLMAEYEKLKVENGFEEMLIRHIMADTRDEIESLFEQIEQYSFEQIANIHNKNDLGGLVGWVTPSEMIQPIHDVLVNLPVKTISSIIESDFGFHLIRIDERRNTEFLPFEVAKNNIRSILVNRRIDEILYQLKAAADIQKLIDFSDQE